MLNKNDLQVLRILVDNGINEIKSQNGNYRQTVKAIHELQNLRNKLYIEMRELPERLPTIPIMYDEW